MNKKIIQTDRMYLRELCADDLDALSKILRDEETMYAYEGAFSEAETLEWLERQQTRYQKYGFGLWAAVLNDTDELIGQCGLTMQPWRRAAVSSEASASPDTRRGILLCDEHDEHIELLEVGYLFRRDCWHKGYATEAARACMEYAFRELNADEVCSIIRDTNTASQRVALRNGMSRKDSMIKHYRGVDMPHFRYSITRGEFLK